MLLAIAFIPVNNIIECFENLKDDAPLLVLPLFVYFREQWLETIDPTLWNMYGIRRRTNNDVEGWHNRFSRLIGKYHPNIYQFVEKLLAEQATTTLQQIRGGQNVGNNNKIYLQINNRITRLQEQFDDGDINVYEYLSKVSYNISNPIAL
ncbi:uncharacterized protein LOC126891368 [Diabrotica virgifera virgifera]|uniref:MULE transposase domain-containing protein n=1 Tax=Diabrotica virgifera virgifera TaxID=50390 RepID=A0ABM5L240_DIAVI|nr:uncharacterized protein LOC126891368 [Diabrotica virgifera virgifera]